MNTHAPEMTKERPQPERITVAHDSRDYPLVFDRGEWRLRSRSKRCRVDYRTGTSNLTEAKRRAKEWLTQNEGVQIQSRKGGGCAEALAQQYLALPKRTKEMAAKGNVSRLRTICRVVLNRELKDVTCREIGPDLWKAYQRICLEKAGKHFDFATRNRENVAINAAIRSARCLFLDYLIPEYRKAGLDVRPDADNVVVLPTPNIPPTAADDSALLAAWPELLKSDAAMWLTIGLARFAGLRRCEIMACRGSWVEKQGEAVFIAMHDRGDTFRTKGAKAIYRAQVINDELAAYLASLNGADELIVETPPTIDRVSWFTSKPQKWAKRLGIELRKPLHHLRSLYANHILRLNADAIAVRLAGERAAQANLGHANIETTRRHYLDPK